MKNIALFLDYDNIDYNKYPFLFPILKKELENYGRLRFTLAYANWAKTKPEIGLHLEEHNIAMYHIPHTSDKNSSDIHLASHATELIARFNQNKDEASKIHIVAIYSEDRDFGSLHGEFNQQGIESICIINNNEKPPKYIASNNYQKIIYSSLLAQKTKKQVPQPLDKEKLKLDTLLAIETQREKYYYATTTNIGTYLVKNHSNYSITKYGYSSLSKWLTNLETEGYISSEIVSNNDKQYSLSDKGREYIEANTPKTIKHTEPVAQKSEKEIKKLKLTTLSAIRTLCQTQFHANTDQIYIHLRKSYERLEFTPYGYYTLSDLLNDFENAEALSRWKLKNTIYYKITLKGLILLGDLSQELEANQKEPTPLAFHTVSLSSDIIKQLTFSLIKAKGKVFLKDIDSHLHTEIDKFSMFNYGYESVAGFIESLISEKYIYKLNDDDNEYYRLSIGGIDFINSHTHREEKEELSSPANHSITLATIKEYIFQVFLLIQSYSNNQILVSEFNRIMKKFISPTWEMTDEDLVEHLRRASAESSFIVLHDFPTTDLILLRFLNGYETAYRNKYTLPPDFQKIRYTYLLDKLKLSNSYNELQLFIESVQLLLKIHSKLSPEELQKHMDTHEADAEIFANCYYTALAAELLHDQHGMPIKNSDNNPIIVKTEEQSILDKATKAVKERITASSVPEKLRNEILTLWKQSN